MWIKTCSRSQGNKIAGSPNKKRR